MLLCGRCCVSFCSCRYGALSSRCRGSACAKGVDNAAVWSPNAPSVLAIPPDLNSTLIVLSTLLFDSEFQVFESWSDRYQLVQQPPSTLALGNSMGAPKQKWTAEEESALKAGVVKHGSGNWRTILRDPEFCGILYLRSNVDLKDKWRNMRVTANGWGSREKARIALRKTRVLPQHDDNSLALIASDAYVDDEFIDSKPLENSSGILQITGPKASVSKMEDLIIEAITSLKEPKGSNKTAIATYIEDQYMTPPDFKLLLSIKLKAMTGSEKLIKVKRKYRIAPTPAMMGGRKSKASHLEVMLKDTSKDDRHDKSLSKFQVDAELAWMRNMTPQEAAAAAAQAIAEAEKAMAEAEEATREAEAAEADAEAAQAFAEAALLTLKSRNSSKLMVHA